VGPKLAQTVLSGISPADLLEAIRTGNVASLRAVPGVGAKMAERVLVELRDRTNELAAAVGASGTPPRGPDQVGSSADQSARDQTLSALLNLGYPKAQAERVLEGAAAEAGSDASIEALVRAALKRLLR
jgi:Holliday junction DNA helicase RuvA